MEKKLREMPVIIVPNVFFSWVQEMFPDVQFYSKNQVLGAEFKGDVKEMTFYFCSSENKGIVFANRDRVVVEL